MKFRADSDSEIDSPPNPNPGIFFFGVLTAVLKAFLGALAKYVPSPVSFSRWTPEDHQVLPQLF